MSISNFQWQHDGLRWRIKLMRNTPITSLFYCRAILTSLKIMEVMMARKKKLSELAEGFTVYPQVLTNVRVTDKKAAQDDADVQAAVKKVTEELGDTGRILVRESGTEPVVRVMVEAESEEICQKYVDMVVNVIKENGYVAG